MVKTDTIQKTKYLVTSADVDFEEKIHVSALINFLIQSAWRHAETLGWGVNILKEHNLSWVLSGMKLEVFDYPKWKEELIVETWPKGVHRLFYLRDYIVYDKNFKTVAKATSNWLMIDVNKRRPKLKLPDNLNEVISENKHAISELVPTINIKGELNHDKAYEVLYTHIDVNQHLTTTGYIHFVMNTFDPEFISGNRPKKITINFHKEILFGSKLKMSYSSLKEGLMTFNLFDLENKSKPCFTCELMF
jgi:acyl-ACP thioesterase